MKVEDIITYCLEKKRSYLDYPFGQEPICVKVNNKIFAELYPREENYKITLKCDIWLAEMYRKQYPGVVIRGYHCPSIQQPHRNTVYINKTVSDDELMDMIDHSYEQVIKSFSKKIQKEIFGGKDA